MSHGGKREGAGRKPDPDKMVTVAVRMPQSMIDRLSKTGSRSADIRAAIELMLLA